jgi:hypothetical protein
MSRTRAEKRVEYRFENVLNLTSRIELLANFKRAELEIKKEFVSNSINPNIKPNQFLSGRAQIGSTPLISSSL